MKTRTKVPAMKQACLKVSVLCVALLANACAKDLDGVVTTGGPSCDFLCELARILDPSDNPGLAPVPAVQPPGKPAPAKKSGQPKARPARPQSRLPRAPSRPAASRKADPAPNSGVQAAVPEPSPATAVPVDRAAPVIPGSVPTIVPSFRHLDDAPD